jgi:NAD(P)-dependent dehydrogenase (short-subunit alcohol dehydrogenase family)
MISGKMNILIIGGTSGIGRELAELLAKADVNRIIVTGRNEDALKALAAEYTNVSYIKIDLTDNECGKTLYARTTGMHIDCVDILINVAGRLAAKDFIDFDEQEARKIMEVNFFGPASVIRNIKPLMPKGSHIINISSMGGFQGSSKYRGLSYYSASKAAIACLSECLAGEFAESGISVNCLALGSVQTEMLAEAFPGYKAPVNAGEIAEFIADFALKGHRFFNGKILPVALANP